MKLLKKKILLSLSLPNDFTKKSVAFSLKSYNYLYFLLDFKPVSIRSAISQLVQSGEVERSKRQGSVWFRLTGVGHERLISLFPLSVHDHDHAWDGQWRLVIKNGSCSLPVSRLVAWGWRKVIRGVYLAPQPLSRSLKNFFLSKNLLGKVILVEKSHFFVPENRQITQKLWYLEALEADYRLFISRCQQLLKKLNSKKKLKNQDKISVVELFETYFSLLCRDPGLPKKLLAKGFPADFARKVFLSIFSRLENKTSLDIF